MDILWLGQPLETQIPDLFLYSKSSLYCRHHIIRGENNVVADHLSKKDQVISTVWLFHQSVCDSLWKVWGCLLVDLFATRMNYRLTNFVFPFPDTMANATVFLFPDTMAIATVFPFSDTMAIATDALFF
ncbi:hypothetical protein E2C01_062577 [Portunus trituberculatus]|uniref:Uncharacterized protein n=1 Tax=Portunus trituberculatus TaxID=210409 RepID=A0A5B7HGG4_PORTR|nr:hypothetical protein [Portunus trituberculatus]